MARPRTIEDEAILAALSRVLRREGPSGVTFQAVANEVGLSPATLVQRFGSKRGLLLALARQAAESAGTELRDAKAKHRSPLKALETGLAAMASTVDTPDAMAHGLASLQLDVADPEFREQAERFQSAVRSELHALLSAAVDAGELQPVDTRRLAEAVHAVYNGALITWATRARGSAQAWLRRQLETVLAPHRR